MNSVLIGVCHSVGSKLGGRETDHVRRFWAVSGPRDEAQGVWTPRPQSGSRKEGSNRSVTTSVPVFHSRLAADQAAAVAEQLKVSNREGKEKAQNKIGRMLASCNPSAAKKPEKF